MLVWYEAVAGVDARGSWVRAFVPELCASPPSLLQTSVGSLLADESIP